MKYTRFFVYGTLRRDRDIVMFHLLARYADFVSYGTYQGNLYKIDHYPGAVPSGNPSDIVQGVVYRLRVPDLVLPYLDVYEEYGPGFPEPTEYIRKIQHVQLRSGETIQAFVYIYNRPTDNFELVPSVDFLKIRDD